MYFHHTRYAPIFRFWERWIHAFAKRVGAQIPITEPTTFQSECAALTLQQSKSQTGGGPKQCQIHCFNYRWVDLPCNLLLFYDHSAYTTSCSADTCCLWKPHKRSSVRNTKGSCSRVEKIYRTPLFPWQEITLKISDFHQTSNVLHHRKEWALTRCHGF